MNSAGFNGTDNIVNSYQSETDIRRGIYWVLKCRQGRRDNCGYKLKFGEDVTIYLNTYLPFSRILITRESV